MASPRRNTARTAAEPERFDICDELAVDEGEPLPARMLGVEFEIRRSYTGEEAARYHGLTAANRIREAIDLITGGSGDEIWEKIKPLPSAPAARLLNKIISLSGLDEGKLQPLSPPLSERMAGAVLSQAVADGSASTSGEPSENSPGETAAG